MFWFRNKKLIFEYVLLIKGLYQVSSATIKLYLHLQVPVGLGAVISQTWFTASVQGLAPEHTSPMAKRKETK